MMPKTPVEAAAEKFNEGIDPASLSDEDSVYVFVDQQAQFQEVILKISGNGSRRMWFIRLRPLRTVFYR
jgi:hypothetical protein